MGKKKGHNKIQGREGKGEKKMDKIVIRTARRSYILIYLMVVVLILFLIVVKIKGIPTSPSFFWGVVIIAIMGVKTAEIHRLREKYVITNRSVAYYHGIFNVKIKSIDHVSITEVIVNQGFIQKLLNVGDVKILVFSDEKSQPAIRNVSNPTRIAEFIEMNMMRAKRGINSN